MDQNDIPPTVRVCANCKYLEVQPEIKFSDGIQRLSYRCAFSSEIIVHYKLYRCADWVRRNNE